MWCYLFFAYVAVDVLSAVWLLTRYDIKLIKK